MKPDLHSTPDLTGLYTPGQLDLLTQLRGLQTARSLSDAQFVQRHLTISPTTWSRLNNGTYAADASGAFVKLDANLRQMRVESARNSKLTGSKVFFAFAQQSLAIAAVTTCKLKTADDPNRFVAYLAPTGGGKTALGRELKIMHDGILVEGRESWRKSYYAALCDIGAAAGVSAEDIAKGEHAAEVALLKKLNANRRVLIIDEGEYFGPRTVNLVKLILNQSPTVVVVLAIPELFERWQKAAWQEAKQINRRAEAIVSLEVVTPEEVQKFADDKLTAGGYVKTVAGLIAKAANEFGGYDLVTRVVAQLAVEEAGEVVSESAAEQAILCVKKLLKRVG